jgi:hypothetical protein
MQIASGMFLNQHILYRPPGTRQDIPDGITQHKPEGWMPAWVARQRCKRGLRLRRLLMPAFMVDQLDDFIRWPST